MFVSTDCSSWCSRTQGRRHNQLKIVDQTASTWQGKVPCPTVQISPLSHRADQSPAHAGSALLHGTLAKHLASQHKETTAVGEIIKVQWISVLYQAPCKFCRVCVQTAHTQRLMLS